MSRSTFALARVRFRCSVGLRITEGRTSRRNSTSSRYNTPYDGVSAPLYSPVSLIREPLHPMKWDAFSAYVDNPILLEPFAVSEPGTSRAFKLITALREGENYIVDVEHGRFDNTSPNEFNQIGMQLRDYLDWLESDRNSGLVANKQVYLAQWREYDEIEAVHHAAVCPPALSELIAQKQVDLYQSALFLGPTGAATPLHYDPYMNLFHLQASSASDQYAKHVILLPPAVSSYLRDISQRQLQRNTCSLDLRITRRSHHDSPQFRLEAPFHSESEVVEMIQQEAITCIVREGETLFIPRGWWHRVENVCLTDGPGESSGWTAGLSWWFLQRSTT